MPGAHHVHAAATLTTGGPAFFVDRDGTIIDDPGYISEPDAVRLIPGAAAALRRFRDAGYPLVLVTNQSGIGRGYYDWAAYDAVAARLRGLLAAEGVSFALEMACGHSPEEGEACGWRKPASGMVIAAAAMLQTNLGRSLIAGDKLADVEAGANAGLKRAAHVLTGAGTAERSRVVAWSAERMPVELLDDLSALKP